MRISAWKGRADLTNRNNEEHGSVTPLQLITILAGTVIGVGVLAFPRFILTPAGTGGPLATLLGAVPALIAWLAWVKLERMYPGRSPSEYEPKLLTRPIGMLLSAACLIWLIIITAFTVREFGEVLKAAILPNTPIEVTVIALLLTTAYFVRYDVQVFARVYEVFFPLMVVPLTLLGLLAMKNARVYYLLPVVGQDWMGFLDGVVMASVGYVGMIIGPYLLPALNRPKQAVTAGLWGLGTALGLYFIVVTATLAVFGPEEVKRLVWPAFELIKVTTVPGFILERLESAFIGIWVAAVFTTVGATYYAALLGITQMLKLRDHKVMAIPLVPILYMIGLIPDDVHTLYRFVRVAGLIGVILIIVKPVLMVGIGYLRGKGAAAHAGSTQ